MNISEFATQIKEQIEGKLNTNYRVDIHEVRKNNNVKMTGLIILPENLNVSPTIYLDSFFEAYENGTEMNTIVDSLLELYWEGLPQKEVDMDFFKEYEKVKDRICYRLINYEMNKDFLEKVPYIPYLDLAIVFYYSFENEQIGKGTIAIYNSHKDMWGISNEELWKAAEENTKRLCPYEVLPMVDILNKIFEEVASEDTEELLLHDREEMLASVPMQVLSNVSRFLGAVGILCTDVLEETAKIMQDGFYILPSSIHEGVTC